MICDFFGFGTLPPRMRSTCRLVEGSGCSGKICGACRQVPINTSNKRSIDSKASDTRSSGGTNMKLHDANLDYDDKKPRKTQNPDPLATLEAQAHIPSEGPRLRDLAILSRVVGGSIRVQ